MGIALPKDNHFGGTSASAPIVAGVAAKVQDVTGKTGLDLKQHLCATAEDVGLPKKKQGYGLVDAAAACGIENTDENNNSNKQIMSEIEVRGKGPTASYRFEVINGTITPTSTVETQWADNISDNGTTASGVVGPSVERYKFTGKLINIELNGPATINID